MKKVTNQKANRQLGAALDMLDYVGGDLSTSGAERFWKTYGEAEDWNPEDRKDIFLMALSLLREGTLE